MRRIIKFFDKLEDKIREKLSRRPIIYAIIGGAGVILYWRGIWIIADELPFMNGFVSMLVGLVMLLATGLLVSSFIGDQIIISGLKKEKKLVEKTESEIVGEEVTLKEIKEDLERLKMHIDHIEKAGKIKK